MASAWGLSFGAAWGNSWGAIAAQSQPNNIAGIYSAESRNKAHILAKQQREKRRQKLIERAGKETAKAAAEAINLVYPQLITEAETVDIQLVRQEIADVFPLIELQWSQLLNELVWLEYEKRRAEDEEFAIVYALYEM